ncbi:MAG: TlyA family RNA methyltransferase [Firmicutes bacterium]|nr:TlyA family RNA methyltransferase [Bacillota bacterium]
MAGEKEKKRLDVLLVEKNIFPTRSRARAEIMAGNVFVNGKKSDKPGSLTPILANIDLHKPANPYVSRGGLKLKKALDEFRIDLKGKIVLDIGASTGGFTQCALDNGAEKVYALDVGYGQLAWVLRNHPRVVNMERFNVRFLKKEDLSPMPHLAVIDVSFISLEKVLPVVAQLGINEVICLIKPQFEAPRSQVGKKGVVKDKEVHEKVLEKVVKLSLDLFYRVEGITFSPLKGPKGNIEFLLYLLYDGVRAIQPGDKLHGGLQCLIREVVLEAHSCLKKN